MPFKRSIRSAAAALLCLTQLFPGVSSGRAIGLPPVDTTPPEILHTPLTAFPAGMPLRVQALVRDDVAVGEVILLYRSPGDNEYRSVTMLEAPGSDIYSADLPETAGPRIEYFIQASDAAGNAAPDRAQEPYLITLPELPPLAAAPAGLPALAPAAEREGAGKWLWIGLGVVAVAALVGGGSGGRDQTGNSGSGGNTGTGSTGTVTITAPLP